MFTDHNKAKVEGNKPKASVTNQITAALPKVSFNNEVLSGRRKAPINIKNTVYPNKKVKVDNDAKVDKLDHIIATSIKITAMAPSSTSTSTTSTSLDGALNDCVLSVNDSDVLCGRGKGKPHNHVGNINYRDLVAANQVSTPYAAINVTLADIQVENINTHKSLHMFVALLIRLHNIP